MKGNAQPIYYDDFDERTYIDPDQLDADDQLLEANTKGIATMTTKRNAATTAAVTPAADDDLFADDTATAVAEAPADIVGAMAKHQASAGMLADDDLLSEPAATSDSARNDTEGASAFSVPAPDQDQPFVIDFAKVVKFTPAKAGWHNATIVSANPKFSAAGNPMIALKWKIEGGEDDGKTVYDNLVFAPNALWRVRQVLEALGYPSNFSGSVSPEQLLGEGATLQLSVTPIKKNGSAIDPVTNEPYGDQNSVDRVVRLGSVAIRAVDDLL